MPLDLLHFLAAPKVWLTRLLIRCTHRRRTQRDGTDVDLAALTLVLGAHELAFRIGEAGWSRRVHPPCVDHPTKG